jgi:hypothetical protein
VTLAPCGGGGFYPLLLFLLLFKQSVHPAVSPFSSSSLFLSYLLPLSPDPIAFPSNSCPYVRFVIVLDELRLYPP